MAEDFYEFFSSVGRNVFMETQLQRDCQEDERGIVLEVENQNSNVNYFRPQPVHPDQIAFIITRMEN